MAEAALGVLGALSAILQIANSLVSSTQQLCRSIRQAKAAPKELQYFCSEAGNLASLISFFHKLAQDAPVPAKRKERDGRDRLLAHVRLQCTFVQGGVRELVSKFIETHDTDIRVMTMWSRVLWVIRRPDMEELKLLMVDARNNLTLLTNLLMWEEARRRPNNEDKIRDLERQLREVTESAKQARRELRAYHEKHHPPVTVNNGSQQKLDELLVSTKAIEKHVVRALQAEERRRSVRQEQRISPNDSMAGHPGEVGGGGTPPPSPPPNNPIEIRIGPSRPRSPGPGPPLGNMGGDEVEKEKGKGGSIISVSEPLQSPPPANNDTLRSDSIEEARSRQSSHTSFKEQQRSSEPIKLTVTVPSANPVELVELIEETIRQLGRSRTSSEKPRHSPVPSPPLTAPPPDDIVDEKSAEEAQPRNPLPESFQVQRHSPIPASSSSPLLPPPQVPPAPKRRKRIPRGIISEESGVRPTDAKFYTTNTTHNVPKSEAKQIKEPQNQQGRSLRLAKDERRLYTDTLVKQKMQQLQEEGLFLSPLQEKARQGQTFEERRTRRSRSHQSGSGSMSSLEDEGANRQIKRQNKGEEKQKPNEDGADIGG